MGHNGKFLASRVRFFMDTGVNPLSQWRWSALEHWEKRIAAGLGRKI